MLLLEVVIFPYTQAYSGFTSEPAPSIIYWFLTWANGSFYYFGLSLLAQVIVFYLCEAIARGAEKVHIAADQGATFDQRLRNAQWFVRVDRWLRIVRRRTGARPMLRGGCTDQRLTDGTRRSSTSRYFILLASYIGVVVRVVKAVVISWFGAFSIAATTVVVYRSQVRSAAADIIASLRDVQIPISATALVFTIVTFFFVNAVNWRRRALSKWRSDYAADGYADIDRIRVIMLHLLSLFTPALMEWHSTMARSWQGVFSSRRIISLSFDDRSWMPEFGKIYQSYKDDLRAIEDITCDPYRRSKIRYIAPRAVRSPLLNPRDYLDLDIFSPATRQQLDELVTAAEDKHKRCHRAVHTGIAAALAAAEPAAEAQLHHHLDRVGGELLGSVGANDVSQRYCEDLEVAIAAATQHLETELHHQLGKLRFDEVVSHDTQQRYRAVLGTAMDAVTHHLKVEFRQHLKETRLHQLNLRGLNSRNLFFASSELLAVRQDNQQCLDTAIRAAIDAVSRKTKDELQHQLDQVLADSDDKRHYHRHLDGMLRDACQTQAELRECVTTLNKLLFPQSLWSRIRAAFNR
jgi:hypothetical protein